MTEAQNLSTGTAAAKLDVTQNTLLRWMRQGIVTPASTTAGGHHRWNMEQLHRQLAAYRPMTIGALMPEPPADKPQRPAVITAIVTSPKGVLVGKRNDGKPPWTFIAGENEPGESPADTIIREVKRKAGLQIVPDRILGERVHPKTGRHMVYLSARPAGTSARVFVGDEGELGEVRWVTRAEADELLPGLFEPVRKHLAATLG